MSHPFGRLAFLVIAITGLLNAAAIAQDPAWAERLEPPITKAMSETPLAGVAIGIVADGKLVYARGFGFADTEKRIPVTPDTVFHMASITKPFVATAIMQLVAKGKLSLDDTVVKYLPYFEMKDPQYRKITIREMLTHTSGTPDVDNYEWNKPQYDDGALERYVRGLKNQKMLWEPGTRFSYSNMAFEVLADVIAKASGMTFEDYVADNILTPTGMTSSTLLKEKTDPVRLANGYTGKKKIEPIRAYPYNRPHNASSDLMSSVNDMARWAMINLNRGELDGKRILNDGTYDQLWRPAAEVEVCETLKKCHKLGNSVGLSWFVRTINGHLIVSHSGGDDGFITQLGLIPDKKFAFIFLSNSDTASDPLMHQLYKIAIEAVIGPVSK